MLLSVAAAVLLTATGSAQNTEISSTDGLRVQSSTSRWYDLMSQTMPLDRNGIRLELPQYDGWYKYMGMDTGHAVYRMNTDVNREKNHTIEAEYLEWSFDIRSGTYQLWWFINGQRTGGSLIVMTVVSPLIGDTNRGFSISYDSPHPDESWAPTAQTTCTTSAPTTASPTTGSPTKTGSPT
eukprot:130656_1